MLSSRALCTLANGKPWLFLHLVPGHPLLVQLALRRMLSTFCSPRLNTCLLDMSVAAIVNDMAVPVSESRLKQRPTTKEAPTCLSSQFGFPGSPICLADPGTFARKKTILYGRSSKKIATPGMSQFVLQRHAAPSGSL